MTYTPLNIYQRINEVRRKVDYLKRDKEVDMKGLGKYRAVTHDMVTAKLHDHLVDQGIIVCPCVLESETIDSVVNGKPRTTYRGRFRVSLVNMDDPEDILGVSVDAHAIDMGDKAPGKALSYATKSVLLKIFSLETGEDEESRVASERPQQHITEEQAAKLRELITAADADEDKLCAWLGAKGGIDQIKASDYKRAEAALVRKQRAAAKRGESNG